MHRNPDSGRRAISLLATAIVLLMGAAATGFMLLAVVDQPSWRDWVVWGGLFACAALFLWWLDRPTRPGRGWRTLAFWLTTQDRTNPLETYRFRKRRVASSEPMGTNQPPTLESLREAADDSPVKWVPHGPPPERQRPPRRH